MNLIPDWKKAYKLWSVQVGALIVALAALAPFAGEIAGYLPGTWERYIFGALGLAAIIARVLIQPQPITEKDKP